MSLRARLLLVGIGFLVLAGGLRAGDGVGELTGVFAGHYFCNQGRTGLRLHLTETEEELPGAAGPVLVAEFEFFEDPLNPGVPAGRFRMRGLLDRQTRQLHLRQDRWMVRPPSYVMVDLVGTLDEEGVRLEGRVEGPGCSRFHLRRLREGEGWSWLRGPPELPDGP